MIESMELFFATYKNIALAVMTFFPFLVGVSAIVYRVFMILDKKKSSRTKVDIEIFQRLSDLEKRLHLLDCPEDGRVNKLSKLTEEQIHTNKVSYGLAKYVKGRLDATQQ